MFRALPSYGFYCRHVRDITFSNVRLSFEDSYWRLTTSEHRETEWATKDGVPTPSKPGQAGYVFVGEDISGLHIDNLSARPATEGTPMLRFDDVRNATVRGCAIPDDAKTFLEISGSRSSNVCIAGDNALQNLANKIFVGKDTHPDSVRITN